MSGFVLLFFVNMVFVSDNFDGSTSQRQRLREVASSWTSSEGGTVRVPDACNGDTRPNNFLTGPRDGAKAVADRRDRGWGPKEGLPAPERAWRTRSLPLSLSLSLSPSVYGIAPRFTRDG